MTVSYKENFVQHIQYLYISLDWRQGISGILKTTSVDNTIILSRLEAAPTLLLQNIVVGAASSRDSIMFMVKSKLSSKATKISACPRILW